jgi:F420H(2)-dependent quinone reductase
MAASNSGSDSTAAASAGRAPAMQRYSMRVMAALYRLSGGVIGGKMAGERVLLLTTTGRKSGKPHTIPISYFEDSGTLFVIASNAGREWHPAWYLNLSANPHVEVQIGSQRWVATARTAEPEERERLLDNLIAHDPQRAERQPQTRQIPVVILERATG